MTIDELFELCHQQAHDAEDNPEDTCFFALTRKDTWMVHLALLLLRECWPCLYDESHATLIRLAEVVECQKDGWRGV